MLAVDREACRVPKHHDRQRRRGVAGGPPTVSPSPSRRSRTSPAGGAVLPAGKGADAAAGEHVEIGNGIGRGPVDVEVDDLPSEARSASISWGGNSRAIEGGVRGGHQAPSRLAGSVDHGEPDRAGAAPLSRLIHCNPSFVIDESDRRLIMFNTARGGGPRRQTKRFPADTTPAFFSVGRASLYLDVLLHPSR